MPRARAIRAASLSVGNFVEVPAKEDGGVVPEVAPLTSAGPIKPPTKTQQRAGRKLMRKVFAKKDQMASTRADAKRAALAYAERRSGRKLTWKAARKLVKRWAREERERAA